MRVLDEIVGFSIVAGERDYRSAPHGLAWIPERLKRLAGVVEITAARVVASLIPRQDRRLAYESAPLR